MLMSFIVLFVSRSENTCIQNTVKVVCVGLHWL